MRGQQPWPDVHRVVAGGVAVDIAPEGLRHLAVHGREVVANLYPAVRARDWGTLPATPAGADLEVTGSRIVLWRAENVGDHLQSLLNVSWEQPGVLTASVTLTALRDVEINRWGLNICLDAADWADARVLEMPGETRFPRHVAPQRVESGVLKGLFPPMPRLTLRRSDGTAVRIISDGQLLEAEDQRNWTDPTFKIYSGSLSAPLPLVIGEGTVLRQSLRLVVDQEPPAGAGDEEQVVIGTLRELPFVGVQANDGDPLRQRYIPSALAALSVDHLRIDTEYPDIDAPDARLPGAAPVIELAVLVPEVSPAILASIAAAATRLPAGSRVLLHRTGRRTTDATAAAALAGLLSTSRPDLVLVPGSDAYYADLNRDRPRADGLISFSITPTVHAFDTESVFATLSIQEELVRQAREVFRAAPAVSPVTLRLRGDPEVPDAPASARRRVCQRHIDDRLDRLEGAAWTLGSVHALTEGGAYSGTWHELVGARGLLRSEGDRISVVPAFHALSLLGARRRPRVRPVTVLGGGVVGLLCTDPPRLVLASQRPWEQDVRLEPWATPALSRRRLRVRDMTAAATSLSWWDGPGEPIARPGSITLEPFELTEVRLENAVPAGGSGSRRTR
jgi:D-apionolactonase